MCKEFNKTRFLTKPVGDSENVGVPIGQGGCKAVRLKINALNRNTPSSPVSNDMALLYFGDSQSQENELVGICHLTAGQVVFYQSDWTPLIYCNNLEEVFIRKPAASDTLYIQVMIHE